MKQEQLPGLAPHSVLIIDPHDLVRFGLEKLVAASAGLRLVGLASSLAEGLRLIEALRPDLVISDLATGDSSGLDTVRALVAAQGTRGTLIVSAHDEALYAEQALLLGARGYVMKDHAAATTVLAAHTVLRGAIWVSPDIQVQFLNRLSRPVAAAAPGRGRAPHLSERELKIVGLLKSGKTTKQIAGALGVSTRTVDVHRAGIKRKLGLRTGAELVAYASSRF
jgi:DNA-binding NarL/FixJ family response regulator